MAKKLLFYSLMYLLTGIFLFVVGEISVRLVGKMPWKGHHSFLKIEPNGSLFMPHPELGYADAPGRFQVNYPDGFSFVSTQLADSNRITHPLNTYDPKSSKPQIWIFGCSFTFGWSLNDQETYPWLLQQMFPEYEIVNFGVSGYGVLKSFLQFRHALESREKPAMAILAYGAFQDERSTAARSWKKKISIDQDKERYVQPYARMTLGGELKFIRGDLIYHEFPGIRYSALLNFLEDNFNRIDFYLRGSPQVSYRMLKDFQELSATHQIPLLVAGIYHTTPTKKMLEKLHREGIATVDVAVNVKESPFNNLPHDDHPSAAANRVYAEKIAASLRTLLPNPTSTARQQVSR